MMVRYVMRKVKNQMDKSWEFNWFKMLKKLIR